MSTEDRADTIAAALIWMGGVALFAWSWQVSDSLIAALIAAAVVGFFLILLLSTLVAVVAIVLSLAVDFIRPHRTRPDLPRRQPAPAQEIVHCQSINLRSCNLRPAVRPGESETLADHLAELAACFNVAGAIAPEIPCAVRLYVGDGAPSMWPGLLPRKYHRVSRL